MSAFRDAQKVEALGLVRLLPLLKKLAKDGQCVLTEKGRLSFELQKRYGDALANNRNGEIVAIEFKVEEENLYQNFFLETWSNKSREARGWMYTLDADVLWYHFLDEDVVYSMDFRQLCKWFYVHGTRFPEKPQRKRVQLNDTWGRCVPIAVAMDEVEDTREHILSIASSGPHSSVKALVVPARGVLRCKQLVLFE